MSFIRLTPMKNSLPFFILIKNSQIPWSRLMASIFERNFCSYLFNERQEKKILAGDIVMSNFKSYFLKKRPSPYFCNALKSLSGFQIRKFQTITNLPEKSPPRWYHQATKLLQKNLQNISNPISCSIVRSIVFNKQINISDWLRHCEKSFLHITIS